MNSIEFQSFMTSYDLTRAEVAQLLGVSVGTVGHWATGHAKMPLMAENLLRVLVCPVDFQSRLIASIKQNALNTGDTK